MKRLVGAVLAASLAALTPAHADTRETIKIVGSSTVYPYTVAVAEAFADAGRFPLPDVRSTGTGGAAWVGADPSTFIRSKSHFMNFA